MSCMVCPQGKKYKCPKCRGPYCSISCYKVHQNDCPGLVPRKQPVQQMVAEEEVVKTDYLPDEELRVPREKLQLLGQSQKLLTLLKNPALRAKLGSIDGSRQRMTDVWESLQDDEFYQFYSEVMGVLQIEDDD